MKLASYLTAFLIFLVSCEQNTKVSSEQLNPEWNETFPGIWKSEINKPEEFNLLRAANKAPRSKTLNKKTTQEFPISTDEIKASTIQVETLHNIKHRFSGKEY